MGSAHTWSTRACGIKCAGQSDVSASRRHHTSMHAHAAGRADGGGAKTRAAAGVCIRCHFLYFRALDRSRFPLSSAPTSKREPRSGDGEVPWGLGSGSALISSMLPMTAPLPLVDMVLRRADVLH